MAYLGFHKEGAKFSLATSAYMKGGQIMFSNFFPMAKNFFCQRGAMAQWPPKYTTVPKLSLRMLNIEILFCLWFNNLQ